MTSTTLSLSDLEQLGLDVVALRGREFTNAEQAAAALAFVRDCLRLRSSRRIAAVIGWEAREVRALLAFNHDARTTVAEAVKRHGGA